MVIGSMIVSSLRYSSLFGGCILGSLVATLIFWKNQYPSTWCLWILNT